MWNKIKPYVISILAALAVGGLTAWITGDDMNIYDTIQTPPLSPPSILFPIVWTILYILMGISAARIWNRRKDALGEANKALRIYAGSLLMNAMWSIIFFHFKAFLIAFLWLVLLWFVILWTIRAFLKIDKTAAYLQIPYLAWVTFAGYLNLAIYLLNGAQGRL